MSAEPLTREDRDHIMSRSQGLTNSESNLRCYEATVQAAEERAERLRGALEFYASREVYEEYAREYRDIDGNPCESYVHPIEDDDYGSKAREALAADDAARGEA